MSEVALSKEFVSNSYCNPEAGTVVVEEGVATGDG